MMQKNVLITGFEPFDDNTINPSAEFLKWLDQKPFDFKINTLLLPVSFRDAFLILEAKIKEIKPSHVLLTGFAKNRDVLTLEKIAINWVDARIPDNQGQQLKAQHIIHGTPDGIFSTLPILNMQTAAKNAGIPTKTSYSAGEYVCNYLFYQSLVSFHLPLGFIHIPSENKRFKYQDYFKGIHSMLSVL